MQLFTSSSSIQTADYVFLALGHSSYGIPGTLEATGEDE